MAINIGIVGLPNVGKSTLFNALSGAAAEAQNFPFCTIEPNVGVVPVPDPRLDVLAKLSRSEKLVPTSLEFVDIAGLVRGASKGEGLGNQFLGHIKAVDAIAHVVRCFDDPNVVHVDGRVDPIHDVEVIDTELALKDLDTVEKRLERAQSMSKAAGKLGEEAKAEAKFLEGLREHLGAGLPARTCSVPEALRGVFGELFLLTQKPVMFIANLSEADLAEPWKNPHAQRLREHAAKVGAPVIPICASVEAEVQQLPPADRPEFLASLGLSEPGLHKVIRAGYALLGLITFITTGPKETRAWTIKEGTRAPQAAGVIHTDFERGFIKAEVMRFDDLTALGSEAAVRQAGKLRIEGKEYVVQDGDVVFFRFNV